MLCERDSITSFFKVMHLAVFGSRLVRLPINGPNFSLWHGITWLLSASALFASQATYTRVTPSYAAAQFGGHCRTLDSHRLSISIKLLTLFMHNEQSDDLAPPDKPQGFSTLFYMH